MPAMAELLLKRATAASGEVYDVLSGSRIVGSDLAIRCIAGITVGLDSILRLPRRPHADPRLCQVPRGRDAGICDGLAQRMKRTRHKRTPSVGVVRSSSSLLTPMAARRLSSLPRTSPPTS